MDSTLASLMPIRLFHTPSRVWFRKSALLKCLNDVIPTVIGKRKATEDISDQRRLIRRKSSNLPNDSAVDNATSSQGVKRKASAQVDEERIRKKPLMAERRPTPSILDVLCYDIIAIICSFAAPHTLNQMSSVCRRLADIAIPFYLRSLDINIPAKSPYTSINLTTPRQCSALLAWKRSPIFRKISSSVVIFSEETPEAVAQAASLRTFFLSLGSVAFTRRLAFYFPKDVAASCISLLGTVSGCDSFGIGSLESLLDPRTTRIPHFASRKPAGPPATLSITSLSLSPIAFTKSFLPWTIATLNQTQLTSLDLEDLEFSASQLRHLLNDINIPTLQEIHLPTSVPVAALSSFLQRHKSIRRLFISESITSTLPPITRAVPVDNFALTRIVGPAAVLLSILDLLQPSYISMLTIYPDIEGLSHRDLHRVVIHSACTKLEVLEIRLPHDASTTTLAFDPNDQDHTVLSSKISALHFSMAGDRFVFSDDILAGCLRYISMFPKLSRVSVNDFAVPRQIQKAAFVTFAESVRRVHANNIIRVEYNFAEY